MAEELRDEIVELVMRTSNFAVLDFIHKLLKCEKE